MLFFFPWINRISTVANWAISEERSSNDSWYIGLTVYLIACLCLVFCWSLVTGLADCCLVSNPGVFWQLHANVVQSEVVEAELIVELVLIKTPRRIHACSKSEKCCNWFQIENLVPVHTRHLLWIVILAFLYFTQL